MGEGDSFISMDRSGNHITIGVQQRGNYYDGVAFASTIL